MNAFRDDSAFTHSLTDINKGLYMFKGLIHEDLCPKFTTKLKVKSI